MGTDTDLDEMPGISDEQFSTLVDMIRSVKQ
jgi:hypothetical protein